MNDTHIPEDDLVLFALQLLPEDRMRQAKQHVDTCELCRSEIAKLQGDLVAYSMTSDIQAPPPAARERLMRQVAKEPRLAPQEPPSVAPVVAVEDRGAEPVFPTRQSRGLHKNLAEDEPEKREDRRRPRRAPWAALAWTGWAVAAGCSFVAGLQLHQRQQMQNSMAAQQAQMDEAKRQAARARDTLATLIAANAVQMPLHATPPAKSATPAKPGTATTPPEALVAYIADKGSLVFIGTHMEPAPTGKTYELWLIPSDGNPMPAGTFKPDAQGRARLMMPRLPAGIAAKSFGVTLENEGGADTPALPMIMSGT